MVYNNVKALLNSDKRVDDIVHYDFKNEKELDKKNTNIAFWLEYRNNSQGWDCDGSGRNRNVTCGLARDVYRVLWAWESEKESRYKNAGYFDDMHMGPDTMNSYFTVLTQVMGIVNPEGKKQYFKTIKGKKHWSSADTSKDGFLKLIDNVQENNEVGALLVEYAKLTHTIGNFVLVPAGFNAGRVSKTDDYWDLSLMLIETGVEWMPTALLQKYVNTFFLWDYVDENCKIKSFFATHSLQNKQPATIQEAVELLQTITTAIVRRGYFMVAMLKIAEQYSENYEQILKEIAHMKSTTIEDAMEIIRPSINEDFEILEILNKVSSVKKVEA